MGDAITIRQLPHGTKDRLRMRAAANGRSMEAEARSIMVNALDQSGHADLSWIEQLIKVSHEVGGVELDQPVDQDATYADFRRVADE